MMRVVVTRKHTIGRWYVKLVAGNNQTVLHSQRYASKSNAVRAASDIVQSRNTEPWVMEIGEWGSVEP